jgi:hypothetical protein
MALSYGNVRCGRSWSDANSRCGIFCPSETDAECTVSGETCFGGLDACSSSSNTVANTRYTVYVLPVATRTGTAEVYGTIKSFGFKTTVADFFDKNWDLGNVQLAGVTRQVGAENGDGTKTTPSKLKTCTHRIMPCCVVPCACVSLARIANHIPPLFIYFVSSAPGRQYCGCKGVSYSTDWTSSQDCINEWKALQTCDTGSASCLHPCVDPGTTATSSTPFDGGGTTAADGTATTGSNGPTNDASSTAWRAGTVSYVDITRLSGGVMKIRGGAQVAVPTGFTLTGERPSERRERE